MGTMQICGLYVLSDENTEIRGKKSEKGDR